MHPSVLNDFTQYTDDEIDSKDETKNGAQTATFAMGCFWGPERLFWQQEGVISTCVGYTGSAHQNPTYEQVCSGLTGHAEVVQIQFNPEIISYLQLLKLFWENHDPTQGMRQGNDQGSQYRSAIFTHTEIQKQQAIASMGDYQRSLFKENYKGITTTIEPIEDFYIAEEYHQQYLKKNPNGYCGMGGTGICLPP